MATLYITEIGSQVRKVDERLVVVRDQQVLDEVPLMNLEQVVLVGQSVSLTTPALHALTRRGIDVIYLTGSGAFKARTAGDAHKNGRLRHTQALVTADPARALLLAQGIVTGKIANQRALLRRMLENAGGSPELLAGIDQMAARAPYSASLDELRGIEGLAAREYFGLLRRLLHPPSDGSGWGFERRAYYPPTDPINAMLSFGYTLLLNDLVTACHLVGLDPYLGCFHVIDYGRPSMALDLVEEFRPLVVDAMVWKTANRAQVRLRDFYAPSHSPGSQEEDEDRPAGSASTPAIYLTPEARKKFLAWYAERVNEQVIYPPTGERTTLRRVFQLQAERMARCILGEDPRYLSFALR